MAPWILQLLAGMPHLRSNPANPSTPQPNTTQSAGYTQTLAALETDLANRKSRLYHLAAHRLGGALLLPFLRTLFIRRLGWVAFAFPPQTVTALDRNDLRTSFAKTFVCRLIRLRKSDV